MSDEIGHHARMTPLQRRILILLTIVVGLTRFLAVARSLNDWDEGLFSFGVADYDVNLHHPHPPGYPLFIAAAKVVHLMGVNEFRSLQGIVILGALLLFPALVLFARECGFGFATAICGALIFVFLPNIWIYGGTGFSDIPATAIGFLACWLLLRGRRHARSYLLGAIALGIATGFRTPNLLIGAVPAILATIHRLRARDFRNVALATLLGGAIAGGSYLGAALASGTIDQYRFMLRAQSDYVRTVDSWRNPAREPLSEVAEIFFVRPVEQQRRMGWMMAAIALAGIVAAIVQRRWTLLLPLAVFVPFMLLAWLSLDVQAAGRYAIAYLALHALYAAHALGVIGRRPAVQGALATAVVIVFAVWTWPALRLQRTSDAPVAGAMSWIVRNVPARNVVYVHGAFRPHGEYFLRGREMKVYEDAREITNVTPDSWIVEPRIIEGAHNFVWPRNALWKIIRRRNFEASVLRLSSLIVFREGFYQEEGTGTETFRWTGKEAHATLPAIRNSGRLRMRIYVPIDAIQPPPTIEVRVNGELVERFVGDRAFVEKAWTLRSRKDAPNELVIATSDVVVPGNGDTRPLGLRIDSMSWMPF
jgi:hypothetical protein